MATSVYSVSAQEGVFYVPTKHEAVAAARELRAAGDEYVYVIKLDVTERLGRRDLYCALLNGESWSEGQEEVGL